MTRRLLILLTAVAAIGAVLTAPALAGAPKEDWPKIDGELWINKDSLNTTHHGTALNDELLGGHGDDVIYGELGSDVLWGDYRGQGNTTRQWDTIVAGPGNDWVYASHGRNKIWGGKGKDTIRVWFGRGYVNCGGGRDILYVSGKSDPKVKRKNCEKISHKSARQVAEDK